MTKEWIDLSSAAVIARLNREKLLRILQGGAIEGRKNQAGRWEVEWQSLQQYMQRQAPAPVTAT